MRERRTHILSRTAVCVLCISALSSCIYEYEGDCSEEEGWQKVRIDATYNTEWEIPVTPRAGWRDHWPDSLGISYNSLRPQIPQGLRMLCYAADVAPYRFNLPPEGGDSDIPGGTTDIMFYNNDTEYIVFSNVADFTGITASTRRRLRSTFSSDEPTVSEPDMLFAASSPFESSLKNIEVELHPLVYTYLIRTTVSHGAEHISLVRGTLSGMARSVNMYTRTTLPDKATILYDCTPDDGGINAVVKSFGVPDYRENGEHPPVTGRYIITLELMLDNGNTVTRQIDVSAQISVQPQGGVVMAGNIAITDEESRPPTSGGSFDVDVSDWGENEDIIIDF